MFKKIKQKTYNTLRRSEKWTKTDMVYLAKGGFWLTAGQFIVMLSGFILSFAFANFIPRDIYGTYSYILSITALLTIPSLSGMITAYQQSVARGIEGSINDIAKTRFKWSLIGLAGGAISFIYYLFNDNLNLAFGFLIAGVFIPLIAAAGSSGGYFEGKKLFKESTIYNTLGKIFFIISMVSVVYLSNSLLIIILTYFLINTLINLYKLLIVKYKYKPNKKIDQSTLKYGKHLSVISIFNTIVGQIDKILIWHLLGAGPLAIYAFAMLPIDQLKVALNNIKALAFPKFAKSSLGEIKKTIFIKIAKMSLIVIFIVAAYIIFAPFFYKVFFPKYTDAIFLSQIFSLSLIALPSILVQTVFRSHKMVNEIYKFNIFTSISQLILIVIFVIFYGLLGLVLARVISRFANLAYSIYLLKYAN